MKKYGSDRNFSRLYLPGKNWYVAMSFVYDYGGQIAVFKNGKWRGTLDSPQAVAGAHRAEVGREQALAGEQDHRRGEP